MELLEAFQDAFTNLPDQPNIREYLIEQSFDKKQFCSTMINAFGGRSYNQFLDYGLMALKITQWLSSKKFSDIELPNIDEDYIGIGINSSLLNDDRHDMYQNAGYLLLEIIPKHLGYGNDWYYADLADILIDCFNEDGTGDITYLRKVK